MTAIPELFAPVDFDELEDPYDTCKYGRHRWSAVSVYEETRWRCTVCGSTDPEGDEAK